MNSSIVIEEPERPRHARLPSDLLRLLVALIVGAVGFLIVALLDDVSEGLTVEMVDAAAALPDPLVVTGILAVQMVAWFGPVAAVGFLLARRTYRRLSLVVVAAVVAVIVGWGLEATALRELGGEVTILRSPSWICGAAGRSERACVPGDGFPNTVYLAGFSAGFSVLTPWLTRRWRRAGEVLIAFFLVVRSIDGIVPPVEALLAVAVGYAIGAAVLLAFGDTDRRPRGADIVTALERHGLGVRRLHAADVPARNSAPWFATTPVGRRLFVKVLGPEERSADLLYRTWRALRLKDAGDAPPFLTVRREVEHEAALSLTAWAGGVRTPRLVAAGEVGVDSMLLAFEAVDGPPLDAVESISDPTLIGCWEQLASLHRRRIAHRNLSLANLVVGDGGAPWVTDFGFSELAADDGQLDADVAQLLAATSVAVGAERAVATAADVLGPDRLARAASRLQPAALGSSTRTAVAAHDGLLDAVRDQVATVTGTERAQLEKLERITWRSVAMVAMLGLAFYFLIPQLAEVRLDDVLGASWGWFPLVVLFSFLTYLGATIATLGAVPDRLRLVPTLEAQVGASFVNRISPVKVGGMATNLRFLQRAGVDPPVAVAGIGVMSVVGFLVHMTLLVVFVTTAGRSATESISLPSGEAVLVGLVVVMTLGGLVMLLPVGRRIFLGRFWPIVKTSVSGVGVVASRPTKVLALLGGSFVITSSYILALWYSVEAFGGGLGFVSVGAVYLAGQTVAQAAPTPGGIGAAEAALIAGLTAFGLAVEVAVPAVFLYRFATFWLPILPGWLAVRHLLRTGAL